MNQKPWNIAIPGLILGVIALTLILAIHNRPPDRSLRRYVANAGYVSARDLDSGEMMPAELRAPDPHGVELLADLHRSGQFHAVPYGPKPDFLIRLMVPDEPIEHNLRQYEYVSATGELGAGREWCVVPDAFRQWIREVKASRRIGSVLKAATRFEFGGFKQNGRTVLNGRHAFSEQEWPRLFALLKQSGSLHAVPVGAPTYGVIVSTEGNRGFAYYTYSLATGELGTGDEWVTVPDTFKAWIQAHPEGISPDAPTQADIVTMLRLMHPDGTRAK